MANHFFGFTVHVLALVKVAHTRIQLFLPTSNQIAKAEKEHK
jgi:hypothetical protein